MKNILEWLDDDNHSYRPAVVAFCAIIIISIIINYLVR